MNNWSKYDTYSPTIRSIINRYKYGSATRQDIINKLQTMITTLQQDETKEQWTNRQQSLPEHE